MTHKPSEKACAEAFIEWYNTKDGANCHLYYAEDVFPELKKDKDIKWDYVARQDEANPDWIAIEVKKLVWLRHISRGGPDWRKLCSQITKHIKCKVSGTFYLHFPPQPKFGQKEKKHLIQVIADVIVQAAPAMGVGPREDIGPKVAAQFQQWPKVKSDDLTEYDQWGEYKPHKLEVSRESDKGCEVKLRSLSGEGDVVQEHEQALADLVKNGKLKANTQLGAAKDRGAKKTILLLDCLGCEDILVRKFVKSLDSILFSNIDYIYLLSGIKEVAPIYSAGAR